MLTALVLPISYLNCIWASDILVCFHLLGRGRLRPPTTVRQRELSIGLLLAGWLALPLSLSERPAATQLGGGNERAEFFQSQSLSGSLWEHIVWSGASAVAVALEVRNRIHISTSESAAFSNLLDPSASAEIEPNRYRSRSRPRPVTSILWTKQYNRRMEILKQKVSFEINSKIFVTILKWQTSVYGRKYIKYFVSAVSQPTTKKGYPESKKMLNC